MALLRETTVVEDARPCDEPHLWLTPTRRAFSAALLAAGQEVRAEQVYLAGPALYTANGWSPTGLARARQQTKAAFGDAECLPDSSRF